MKKFLLILSLGLAALVACNKERSAADYDGPKLIEFDVLSDLDLTVSTRATEVTTNTLGNINVTATRGNSTTRTAVFQGVSFSKNGSGNSAYWAGDQVWPSGNTNQYYHFYASNATLSGNGTGSNAPVTITVSASGTNSINTDIVAGSIENPSWRQRNALSLSHIFARVQDISLTAPSGYTVSNLKVSFSPVTTGTYTLWSSNSSQSNTWTQRGQASGTNYLLGSANSGVSISTAGGTASNTSNDFWIVPGTYTLTASYVLSKGGVYTSDTITKTVNNINFQQGKINNISGTLSVGSDGGAVDIDFTVTVESWTENNITNVNF